MRKDAPRLTRGTLAASHVEAAGGAAAEPDGVVRQLVEADVLNPMEAVQQYTEGARHG